MPTTPKFTKEIGHTQELRKVWNTPFSMEGQNMMCRYCKSENTQKEGIVVIDGEEQIAMSCFCCKAKWAYRKNPTEERIKEHEEWLN